MLVAEAYPSNKPLKALLIASVLVPALAFAIIAWQGYRATFEAAESRSRHIVGLLEEHALKTLETVELVLKQTDQRLRGASWDEIRTSQPLWAELRSLQELTAQVDSIFVVSPDGKNPLTTRVFPPPLDVDFSDRDYFVEQKAADRGVYVGQSYIGRISGRPIFNLSIRRASEDGTFNGVIGSSAFVDYFEQFYATAGAPEDKASVLLVRADGQPLVGHPQITDRAGFDPPGGFLSSGSTAGSFTAASPDTGIDRLYSYSKVKDFPVYVVYGIERATLLADWYRHLLYWGVGSAVVAAFLFATSWLALQRAQNEMLAVARWRKSSADLLDEIGRRERAETALLQAQKLEAIGQLTGGIAHDFNNLLTIISGNLELAERKTDLSAVRRLHGSMRYAAQRAEALTRQLLAFSRQQVLRPHTVDLNGVIDAGALLIRRAVGEAVHVDLELDPELRLVLVDPGQFEAALLNIAVNARDAMPSGGKLLIRTANVVLDEGEVAKHHPTLKPGLHACISVHDDGTGMTPDTLARIFEPFFTTKEVGKGTGLGMSQIYGFVQQSGGSIRVESSPGKGTNVFIYLPPSSEPTARIDKMTATNPGASGSGLVLVVEDDEEVRNVVVSTLQDLGYRTLVARNGADALGMIRGGTKADMLLSDILMPAGMDGVELARAVRAAEPRMHVLLMTGHAGRDGTRVIEFPVLRKPFTRAQLAQAVRTAFVDRESAAADS